MTKKVLDDQLIILKKKFQKIETICQNKLRFEPFKKRKGTSDNGNGKVQVKSPGRMAERSKAPDTRRLLNRDF